MYDRAGNPYGSGVRDRTDRRGLPADLTDGAESSFDIRALLLMLLRRRWVLINTVMAITLLATIIVLQLKPRYTATVWLAIETRQSSVVDLEAVLSGVGTDTAALRTEIDVLRSQRLVGQLVDTLSLVRDAEFNEALDPSPSLLGYLNPLTYLSPSWRDALVGYAPANGSAATTEQRTRAEVTARVMQAIAVTNPGLSYTIKLDVTTGDPAKSARMANTLAGMYLADQMAVKANATQRASDWLSASIADLRQNVRQAEAAVQQFREANQLFETDQAGLVTDQQMAQLNADLITAKSDLVEAEARLEQAGIAIAGGRPVDQLRDAIDSPLIQRLREQEAAVLRKRAELATVYGPKHPRMINIEAEAADIGRKITAESRKIAAAIQTDALVARSRVATMEQALARMQQQSLSVNRARVDLAELEREAAASRVLLETFLARSKETSSQTGLQEADARIISPAEIPAKASFPKIPLMLSIAAVIAFGVGVGAVFLLEAMDNRIRSADQVRRLLGLRTLGQIPLLTAAKLKGITPEGYAIQKPNSAFAESFRSIRTALSLSANMPPRVISVTSAVPGEGKTTISSCLARVMASSGQRIGLIECDMRRPLSMEQATTPGKRPDLTRYLEGKAEIRDALLKDRATGLDIMFTRPHANPQRLIGSVRFAQLIDWARAQYDLVILDAPPVLAVSDAILLDDYVDASVFVVNWDSTQQETVKSAVQLLQDAVKPIAGVVINKVDVNRHQSYGYGDQGQYYGAESGYFSN